MPSDKMFGFEDGRVPVGYAFAEDGAIVPSLATFGIIASPESTLALEELHALAVAA